MEVQDGVADEEVVAMEEPDPVAFDVLCDQLRLIVMPDIGYSRFIQLFVRPVP